MDRTTSLRTDIALPDSTTRVEVERNDDLPWGEVTVSLLFPYHLDWRKTALPVSPPPLYACIVDDDGKAIPETRTRIPDGAAESLSFGRRTWDPRAFNSSIPGTPGLNPMDTGYQHWYSPAKYFHSTYLAQRVVADGQHNAHGAWVGGSEHQSTAGEGVPAGPEAVYYDFVLDQADKRIEVMAVERHEFSPVYLEHDAQGNGSGDPVDPGLGIAVITLKAIGFTSDELSRFSEYALKPSGYGDRKKNEDFGLSPFFTGILHGVGLHVQAAVGGFTHSCWAPGPDGTDSLDCHGRDCSPFPGQTVIASPSGWNIDKIREKYLSDRAGTVGVEFELGVHGATAGWLPAAGVARGQLPRAYNRILGVWCLPRDSNTRPGPYNLFHLEDTDDEWTEERRWSYQLSLGYRMTGVYALPDATAEEAEAGLVTSMGCHVRVSRTGIAVLIPEGLNENTRRFEAVKRQAKKDGRRLGSFSSVRPYTSVADLRSLVHGRFVEVSMLALRQRFILTNHVHALAEHHKISGGQANSAEARMQSAFELERRFQWFVNQRWFDEVPGRPEATAVLRALQEQLGSTADLARVKEEQLGIFRLETFAHRERHEENQQRERKREDRNRKVLEYGLAAVAPPSLVFTVAAVAADPSEWTLWQSVAWSLVLMGLLLALVSALTMARSRRNSTNARAATASRLLRPSVSITVLGLGAILAILGGIHFATGTFFPWWPS